MAWAKAGSKPVKAMALALAGLRIFESQSQNITSGFNIELTEIGHYQMFQEFGQFLEGEGMA
jgi:hypothetical protein